MASQRITIAKLAGVSGAIALEQLSTWSAAGNADDQWPERVGGKADEFAERVRAHGLDLPVCYFVEWADIWSMGDYFSHWLTPPNSPGPIVVHANRFEVFAYRLPDGGRLADHLAAAGPQQFPEADWFVARLREAVGAWEKLVAQATLIILRHVVGGSALDEEVTASLTIPAPWLS